ncbi:MAG: N-acetyltransferase family protein [Ruthenibacterium lactatiformans]
MELICRAAAQADLPACCNVFADSEIYERYFSAPGALARSLENALNAGELYVACGSAGEVLGVMRIRAKGFCGLYPYLALIGAAPRARGRGVGHFLLAEFEAMARVQGAGRVALMVSDFNEKAQALYRSSAIGNWVVCPTPSEKALSELVLIKDL